MKTFLWISLLLGTMLTSGAESGTAAAGTFRDYQLKHSSRVRENMEWTTFFATNVADTKKPRIFFIGDSICRDYMSAAAAKIRPLANCTQWTSSRCVTDPLYLQELELFLSLAPNAVVCFNNGLHSQFTNPFEYEHAFRKAIQFLKVKCPQTKLFLITCTPVKDDAFNAAVVRMNRTARQIAAEEKVDVIDAYTFMNRAECGAKWRDGIHFQPAASTALGRKIAETIEPALARTGEQKGASGHDQK